MTASLAYPTPEIMHDVVTTWVAEEQLDDGFPIEHDWVHAHFDLGTTSDGLVYAVELAFERGVLPIWEQFEEDAVDLVLEWDDYGLDDILSAYHRLAACARG